MSSASQSMGAQRFLESKGLDDYARRIVEVTEAHTVEDLKLLDPTMVEDVIHICQMKMISAKKFRLAIEEVKEQPSLAAQAQQLAEPVVASAPPASAPPAQAMPAPYAAPPTQPVEIMPVQAVPVQAIPVQAMPLPLAYAQGSLEPPYRPANYTPAIGVYPQQKKSDDVGMGAALAGGAAALLGGIVLGEAIEHSHHHHRHHHHHHRDIFEVDFGFGGHHHHGRHHHHHHRW
eukprot:gnl/MRDRNA2_/MRDRNA2_61813_c0_seq1.p1 gnl/MRDRNA2_/MRDRNA2_61813_c0~~gnl/MRDRNA2_/MRDRNA2_61813_c0_seq1.p1  ORF type:complete len:232 (+),score=36.66 gnl/MRDRNA2_/MRDRNA2_61813_c0_seq1:65-760(+)